MTEETQRRIFDEGDYKGIDKDTGFQMYVVDGVRRYYEVSEDKTRFDLRQMSLERNVGLEEEGFE